MVGYANSGRGYVCVVQFSVVISLHFSFTNSEQKNNITNTSKAIPRNLPSVARASLFQLLHSNVGHKGYPLRGRINWPDF